MLQNTFYIGCYTAGKNAGIKVVELNTSTGALTEINEVDTVADSSFLKVSDDKKTLFAVSENEENGTFACLDITNKTCPTLRNKQPSLGGAPCHISQSAAQVYVCNYVTGNVSVFQQPSPALLPAISQVQHHGQGGDLSRQSSAHAHASVVSLDQRFLVVADLGIDRLMVYKIHPTHLEEVQSVVLPPGSGPRHLCFSPTGEYLYCGNELDNQLLQFAFNAPSGLLTLQASCSSLPADAQGLSYIAEVAISHDGLFLYVSNRGHDSISVFSITPQTGGLTFVDFTSTQGRFPRHFSLSPDQVWLIVANQNSDDIFVYKRDIRTGRLLKTSHTLQVTTPVCICFY